MRLQHQWWGVLSAAALWGLVGVTAVLIGIAVRECAEALVVLSSPLFLAQRARSAELVVKNHLPATFLFREYAEVGGLMA